MIRIVFRAGVPGILPLLLISCVSYFNRPATANGSTSPDPGGLRELTYEECSAILRKRPFVSQEELFQLFFDLYHTPGFENVVLKRDTIAALESELSTYFPLAGCREIAFSEGLLRLSFEEEQAIPIPGSYRQASLSMSKDVVFAIKPSPTDDKELQFEVMQGGVRINPSSVLRLLSVFAKAIQATVLSYRIDPEKKVTSIGIYEHRKISPENMKVRQDTTAVFVDAVHPDLPDEVDLTFREDAVSYFGMEMKLVGGDQIQLPGEEPRPNPELHTVLKKLCADVLQDPDASLRGGVEQLLSATFDAEARKLHFRVGFAITKVAEGK